MSETVRVSRRAVEITHPEKDLFSDPPITKLELARYYASVADAMVPLIRGRPLALQVYPGGIERHGFFLKSAPAHFPDWIARAQLAKKGGSVSHVVANDAATLVYLAGQNAITPHNLLARADDPRRPDRLIIDLDPADGVSFSSVRAAAREAGARLSEAGLVPYAMVTGSRGVHVVCPLRRGPGFGEVHRFARRVAEAMVSDDPRRLTLEWRREDRGPKIYLDVNRINYAQHAVAPYGVRARRGAPVALPIHWDELSDSRLRPDRWNLRSAPERLEREGDAWRGISRRARKLPELPAS
jgi:bifunctional non-homologous end joining protein LigD